MIHLKNIIIKVEEKIVVDSFSLTLMQGAVHLLIGPNGSGKSSIVQLLLGNPLYKIAGGEIIFQGQDLLKLEPHERACKGLFIVQQEAVSIPGLTVGVYLKAVHDALGLPSEEMHIFLDRVKNTFAWVGLDPSFVERSVHDGFSGGQKKRFELAQVILFKPRCIIFDEIDAGLDEQGRLLLIEVIQKMRTENDQLCVLFISHNKSMYTAFNDINVHYINKIESI